MQPPVFVQGQFQKYRATIQFHIGDLRADIPKDEELEFDGTTMKWRGQSLPMSKLKGAILGGMLVPAVDVNASYKPQVQAPQVTPATPSQAGSRMVTVSEEEREVGTLQGSNAKREAAAHPLPAAVPARPIPVTGDFQTFLAAAQQYLHTMPAGTPIQTVLQGMPRPRDDKEADQVNSMIMEWAKNQPFVKAQREPGVVPGQRHDRVEEHKAGKTSDGKFAVIRTDGQQGVEVRSITGSQGGASVGAPDEALRAAKPINFGTVSGSAIDQNVQPVAVAPALVIKTADQMEGIHEPTYPGVGKPRAYEPQARGVGDVTDYGAVGDVETTLTGSSLEDILPGAARPQMARPPQMMHSDPESEPATVPTAWLPPAPPKKSAEDSIREIVAGWDMTRHWKTRVQEANDFYGNNPAILQALCEIEAPGVVKQIQALLNPEPVAPAKKAKK